MEVARVYDPVNWESDLVLNPFFVGQLLWCGVVEGAGSAFVVSLTLRVFSRPKRPAVLRGVCPVAPGPFENILLGILSSLAAHSP